MLVTRLSEPRGDGRNVAPPLMFTRPAWMKLMRYIEAVEPQRTEISGFGYVRAIGNMLYVTSPDDVFITKQVVTPGSAEVQGSVFARAFDRAVVDDRANELRLQWHKHPRGLPEHSAVDMTTIASYGDFAMEWMVSLVVADSVPCARIDHFQPRVGCEIPVCVLDEFDPETTAAVEREVAELVTVRRPAITLAEPAPVARRVRVKTP